MSTGAKVTNRDIAADDLVKDLKFDFEGKRDRWRGYDPASYQRVIDCMYPTPPISL
jgi:pre-mRNA-processing factor SLU7